MVRELLLASAWSDPNSPGSSRWHLSLGVWGGQNRGEPNSGGECRGHPVKDTHLFNHNPEDCNLIITSPGEIL